MRALDHCVSMTTYPEVKNPPMQSLIKQMSSEGAQASRMSVDSGQFIFHYIIEGGVCYLTLTGELPAFGIKAVRKLTS